MWPEAWQDLRLNVADGFYDGLKRMPLPLRLAVGALLGLLGVPPATAAYTTVFAATVKDPAPYSNKFLGRRRLTGSVFVDPWIGPMLDDDLSKELWETTEKVVADRLAEQ